MKQYIISFLENHSIPSVIGYIVIFLAVIWLLRVIFHPRKVYLSRGDGGTLALTKSALRKVIESVAHDVGLQGKISPKFCYKRSKFIVNVIVKMGSWRNISEVSAVFQERLRSVFVDSLGITDDIKVNVVIAGFLFRKNAATIHISDDQSNCDCDKGFCCCNGENAEEEQN